MLNQKTLKLYSDYVTAYNKNPDSEEANETYQLFVDSIFDNFDPETGDDIIYELCTITDDNKIDKEENLYVLESVSK